MKPEWAIPKLAWQLLLPLLVLITATAPPIVPEFPLLLVRREHLHHPSCFVSLLTLSGRAEWSTTYYPLVLTRVSWTIQAMRSWGYCLSLKILGGLLDGRWAAACLFPLALNSTSLHLGFLYSWYIMGNHPLKARWAHPATSNLNITSKDNVHS